MTLTTIGTLFQVVQSISFRFGHTAIGRGMLFDTIEGVRMVTDTAGSGAPMHHAIARELGIEIIEGTWAAGQARTLEDLQSRFGVSRTVAREVSRQLEAMGLATPCLLYTSRCV